MRTDVQTIDSRLTPLIRELVVAGVPLKLATKAFEEKYIRVALGRAKGSITRAAAMIGVHRNTLHNRRRGRTQ